jgi:hypothetical protein
MTTTDAVERVIDVIADSAPEIADGLRGRREAVDEENPSGERVTAADVWADELLVERLAATEGVGEIATEERDTAVDAGEGVAVAVDPLDGSSNLASNNLMGTVFGVFEYLGQCFADHVRTLGQGDAVLKEQAPDLADDSRAVIDHALSGAMKCLNVLLLDCLLGNTGNVRLSRGRANGFGVVAIRLLMAHKRLYILRTDNLYPVAGAFQLPRPGEGTCTGLNSDCTRLQLRNDVQQLIAHDAAFKHCSPGPINPVQLENALGDVDTRCLFGHWSCPSVSHGA